MAKKTKQKKKKLSNVPSLLNYWLLKRYYKTSLFLEYGSSLAYGQMRIITLKAVTLDARKMIELFANSGDPDQTPRTYLQLIYLWKKQKEKYFSITLLSKAMLGMTFAPYDMTNDVDFLLFRTLKQQ